MGHCRQFLPATVHAFWLLACICHATFYNFVCRDAWYSSTISSRSCPALPRLAEEAFDDQCTGANPRYPLIVDLKQIYLDAYHNPILPVKSLNFYSKV